jgi:protein-S-isoprenylcysteine O-methyltransferase Ste14
VRRGRIEAGENVADSSVGLPLWKQVRAIALLPGMVLLVIPATLLYLTGPADLGWALPRPWSLLRGLLGCGLVGLGLVLMATTIALFHRVGIGTLAPWNPTGRLVVRGVYRHVRNPMISGVLCILLGETLIFDSFPLLVWFSVFLAVNLTYIPLVEEPSLERRFGREYELFKLNVPRWIPRVRPWRGRARGDPEGG